MHAKAQQMLKVPQRLDVQPLECYALPWSAASWDLFLDVPFSSVISAYRSVAI